MIAYQTFALYSTTMSTPDLHHPDACEGLTRHDVGKGAPQPAEGIDWWKSYDIGLRQTISLPLMLATLSAPASRELRVACIDIRYTHQVPDASSSLSMEPSGQSPATDIDHLSNPDPHTTPQSMQARTRNYHGQCQSPITGLSSLPFISSATTIRAKH